MNFPALERASRATQRKDQEHNKVVFHPATMQFGMVSALVSSFFCVCPPTVVAVAKQTAFQIFTDRPAALRKV